MAKSPAYQWYPKDAETDEKYRLMNCEAIGVYERMRDHEWLEGSLPADFEALAALVGHKMSARRLMALWPQIRECFELREDGRLVNQRLEAQRTSQQSFAKGASANGRKGAAKRWGGHSHPTQTLIANDGSASPDCDLQIPPVAPQGGHVTRAERKREEAIRKNWFGRCQHEPKCSDAETCVVALVLAERERGVA